MGKFDFKSVLVGFILGAVGLTTAFAAGGIKTATFSNAKVTLDGASVPLENSLVSILQDGEKDAKLYMPLRELLEYIGYTVNWDGSQNAVNLVSNSQANYNGYSSFGSPNNGSKKTIDNGDIKEQIINNVDIKKLGSLEYVILGTYDLSNGDIIHYDVSASGKGNLSLGFVKSGDDPAKTTNRYFATFNPGSNESKTSTEPLSTDEAGKYTLYVCNISDDSLSNIKGTVIIEKGK